MTLMELDELRFMLLNSEENVGYLPLTEAKIKVDHIQQDFNNRNIKFFLVLPHFQTPDLFI